MKQVAKEVFEWGEVVDWEYSISGGRVCGTAALKVLSGSIKLHHILLGVI